MLRLPGGHHRSEPNADGCGDPQQGESADQRSGTRAARAPTSWEPGRCASGSGVCSTCWHSPLEGATMPERAALITALIMDRPLCMACLRDRTGFTTTLVEAILTRIQ